MVCGVVALQSTMAFAQDLQDPTRPHNVTKNQQGMVVNADGFPTIKVSAVFINESSKHAMINGRMLKEGQQWNGLSVLEIHQAGVVLANQESQKEFLIHINNFKKDASNDF